MDKITDHCVTNKHILLRMQTSLTLILFAFTSKKTYKWMEAEMIHMLSVYLSVYVSVSLSVSISLSHITRLESSASLPPSHLQSQLTRSGSKHYLPILAALHINSPSSGASLERKSRYYGRHRALPGTRSLFLSCNYWEAINCFIKIASVKEDELGRC